MRRYAVIIEDTNGSFSAYTPDLPGCVATGASVEEVETNIRKAIQFHLEGLREEGLVVPEPRTRAEYVSVE